MGQNTILVIRNQVKLSLAYRKETQHKGTSDEKEEEKTICRVCKASTELEESFNPFLQVQNSWDFLYTVEYFMDLSAVQEKETIPFYSSIQGLV